MFSFIGFIGLMGTLLGIWYCIEHKTKLKRGIILSVISVIVCIAGFSFHNLYPVIFAEQIAAQKEADEKARELEEQEDLKEDRMIEGIENILSSEQTINKSYVFLNDGELTVSGYFDTHNGLDYLQELNRTILIHVKHSGVVKNVDISWMAPVLNFYGNKDDTIVMDLDISMEEVNKINFSNFDLYKLKYLANFYSYTNEDGDLIDAESNKE
ncbi:hypothetical protein CD30_12885 [Ureibacillus massiliensis 4400831 = CIP 108448 = CCUG 49529]|uniref:Uncharacterized protein n=1 Tax=Ureibacillus massiliensis 4400831 = CIP 108448 = CCUG 49529 TaxID=1211035 RepID=A0A0A3IZY1_9BACL|nr:hypothetical protein [Ureibacillus massiliensis]KGR90256.1 hypothetical protein CD30_12885 [Ureibacillus massiliensis 4400831 = CIP 108448 = CCUG 49529]